MSNELSKAKRKTRTIELSLVILLGIAMVGLYIAAHHQTTLANRMELEQLAPATLAGLVRAAGQTIERLFLVMGVLYAYIVYLAWRKPTDAASSSLPTH